MGNVPTKGDRLTAKVRMTFYMDDKCTVPFPPVPPGVGYRKSFQVMERTTGQEVGVYTGVSSENAYQVDWVQQYRVTPPLRKAYDAIFNRTSFVKKNEVTGFWDNGVDAPKPPKDEKDDDAPPDNTNLYLGLALAGTAFVKFVLPKIQNK